MIFILTQTFLFLLIIMVFSIIASFSRMESGRIFGHWRFKKNKTKDDLGTLMITEHHVCF